jgi:uncharacterized protein (DUF697 family)
MTTNGDSERNESSTATEGRLIGQLRKRQEADKVVRKHVLYALGAGLVPIPLIDIAAVTAVQIDMLRQIATVYGANYDASKGKAFASALAGSTFARIGASVVKALPGIGTVVGGVSMSVLSGASTYAVGTVAIGVFESGGDLIDANLDSAKKAYIQQFEEGKQFVSRLREESKEGQDVFQALERLGELRQKGVIIEEEFQAQKKKLLDRL